ncbi:MAG TPA: antirestriction protein ArdA [Candidatus Blautia stercoripullorum]|uniref:Antirestriction protein ArdA n=1 Tax=Candidatus Blautia stercoripullorum TaxID=2838502 RepID=A0A9D2RBZ2_9FIRM|nr:antirestriction protein ArdA [Candidatus Blautia stercoripullorum]
MNWICKTVLELPKEYQEELPTLLQYFDDIYAILYASSKIQYYEHCNNMADVARAYLKDVPWFSGLPENVKQYFDYEGFGEQLQSESRYVLGENGSFCFS